MDQRKSHALLNEIELPEAHKIAGLLPEEPQDRVLSVILNRKIKVVKSTRDYALTAFSALYSGAIHYMRAGANSLFRGEVVYLSEVTDSFAGRESKLDQLLVESSSEKKESYYPYSRKIEADVMASAFLRTEGSDTYEGLFSSFLGQLISESGLSNEDANVLMESLKDSDETLSKTKIHILNTIPSMASPLWDASSNEPLPNSLKQIVSYPLRLLDQRSQSFDFVIPVIKDLVLRHREGKIKPNSVGLGAFLPLASDLSKKGILGVVLQIEDGKIKKLSLSTEKKTVSDIPQFGPLRAMIAVTTSLKIKVNSDLNYYINTLKEKRTFIAASVLGAISAPKNAAFALEGKGKLNDRFENKIVSAGELFVLEPSVDPAILLDPVAVTYSSINDNFHNFKTTRLCFFSFDPTVLTPIHQGAISMGVDTDSYESACINGKLIAKQILDESASFISGEFGKDQIVDSYEESLDAIKRKYGQVGTIRMARSEEELLDAISGKYGRTGGASNEIYSLYFQHQFEQFPELFDACTHASKFMSNVRTYPQRFELKEFLSSESQEDDD